MASFQQSFDSIDGFSAEGERGFVVNLKTPLPGKWKCPLCNLLMRNAIQTYRGEMACEACYFTAKGDSNICPIDQEQIEDSEFFKDRHARREILQLDCYCTNKENGCGWEDVVNSFDAHIQLCGYQYIQCDDCKEALLRQNLPHHLEELCDFRQLPCTYCGSMLKIKTVAEHESICHMRPLQCPYVCGANIQLDSIHEHVQQCSMIQDSRTCPYTIIGCQSPITEDVPLHMQQSNTAHAALAISVAKCLQQTNEQLKHELLAEQTKRLELTKKMEEQNEKQKIMEAGLTVWKQKYEEMANEIAQLKDRSDQTEKEIKKNLEEVNLKLDGQAVQEIGDRLAAVEQKYVEAEGKLRNLPGGSHGGGVVGMDEELKRGVERVDQLESGSAVLSANLSELELKLQLLENTCYEGQQLWKVDNVTFRINQAVTGKVTALHSAPCFQKRGGYKFCSRLYLNGDGMGRGTHISLFFVIMKSEYDALLQWPFSDRVTFRLVNPHNLDESMTESFIPDKNSSSFKRPTKDMNIAAGCPMFIKKDLLAHYIVDDALYIETKISSTS